MQIAPSCVAPKFVTDSHMRRTAEARNRDEEKECSGGFWKADHFLNVRHAASM